MRDDQIAELNTQFEDKRPKEIIRHAIENHDAIAVSFSGAEDVILVDMATRIKFLSTRMTVWSTRMIFSTFSFS